MKPCRACPEAAFRIRPPLRFSRIIAAAAWQQRKAPVVFTASTLFQSATEGSSSRLIVITPALLIRMSSLDIGRDACAPDTTPTSSPSTATRYQIPPRSTPSARYMSEAPPSRADPRYQPEPGQEDAVARRWR